MTRIGITHHTPTLSGDCGGTDLHLVRVTEALSELGDIVRLPVDATLPERLCGSDIDIVYNMARGEAGAYERFHVAELCEHFALPFTGGRASAHSVTGSRIRLKEVLRAHDIPAAACSIVTSRSELGAFARRRFPMEVFRSIDLPGPRRTSVARDYPELQELVTTLLGESPEPLSVEPHLDGASFSCLLVGNGRSRTMLPPVAVDAGRYAQERKPVVERIPIGMLEDLESLARRAADAVGCRDIALIDVGLSESGVPTVVGVDALPLLGCTRSDDVATLAATAAGVGMREVVQRCLLAAAERSHLRLPRAPVLARLPRFTPPRGLPAFTARPPA